MKSVLCLALAVGLIASFARAEPVEIVRAGLDAPLMAEFAAPDGDGPHPAVVFLHGCSGLGRGGGVFGIYRSWQRHLNSAGFAVLMIDSAGSRGQGATCGGGAARAEMYRERPGDAFAALAWLQGRKEIDPADISLIGWSQGGAIALLTVVDPSVGRPSPAPAREFRRAVAFYPAACNLSRQYAPYTGVSRGEWRTATPLLILQGGDDNWTRAAPCAAFVAEVAGRGQPVRIKIYPGAFHAFDAPGMAVHERPGPPAPDGRQPIIGTDEAARADAMAAVVRFLGTGEWPDGARSGPE